MNVKRYLESRIRGWLPKEHLGVSLQANILYSERVSVGKFVKAFVGSISILALVVLALSIWFSISIQAPLFAVVIALPLIFVLLLFANFRGIQIKITQRNSQ